MSIRIETSFDEKKFHEWLVDHGLDTNAKVAKVIGKTERTVFNHKAGHYNPRLEDFLKLLNHMGVRSTTFFPEKSKATA